MAASESGADTFAGSGAIIITGAFGAVDAGADTFAAGGLVIISGVFAGLEAGNDNFVGGLASAPRRWGTMAHSKRQSALERMLKCRMGITRTMAENK